MRRVLTIAAGLVLLAGQLAAQVPEPAAKPPAAAAKPPAAAAKPPAAAAKPPAPESPAAAAERQRGELLLHRHAQRCRGVKVLVADYVQRRTTQLSKRPLVSRGAFLFVSKPACVVFRQSKPRESIVRLTSTRYEVFRPRRKRLERFVLDGPEMAQGLFAAIGGDVERLLRDFDVRGCRPVGVADQPEQRLEVRLLPKTAAVRKQLRELLVTLHGKDAQLLVIAYRDPAGDLIEIELSALRANPERAPSVDFDVPEHTKVIEHAARAARDGGR